MTKSLLKRLCIGITGSIIILTAIPSYAFAKTTTNIKMGGWAGIGYTEVYTSVKELYGDRPDANPYFVGITSAADALSYGVFRRAAKTFVPSQEEWINDNINARAVSDRISGRR